LIYYPLSITKYYVVIVSTTTPSTCTYIDNYIHLKPEEDVTSYFETLVPIGPVTSEGTVISVISEIQTKDHIFIVDSKH
jgi:hypothetical protein